LFCGWGGVWFWGGGGGGLPLGVPLFSGGRRKKKSKGADTTLRSRWEWVRLQLAECEPSDVYTRTRKGPGKTIKLGECLLVVVGGGRKGAILPRIAQKTFPGNWMRKKKVASNGKSRGQRRGGVEWAYQVWTLTEYEKRKSKKKKTKIK